MSNALRPLVLKGDCLTQLKRIPDETIAAVVTDPPYGLNNTDPAHVVEALTHWASGDRAFIPIGRGFMGKEWDAFVPPPAVWDECMRILKPGGHLLAFAGSRTFDLMTLSIRFAGFDIRDSIAWLYGSGFPKSLDVSKAIEKAERGDLVRAKLLHFAASRGVDGRWLEDRGVASAASFADWTTGGHVPSDRNWGIVKAALEITLEEETAFEREVIATAASRVGDGSVYSLGHSGRQVGAAVTDLGKVWEGWGTALKPAFEPIIVARKPLSGTVAANVLAHGTGALNIDANRAGDGSDSQGARPATEASAAARYTDRGSVNLAAMQGPRGGSPDGRWPANVILDEDQAAELDRQAPGTGGSGGDRGGASRFFYVAKAPKSERPVVDGTAHPTVKPLALMQWLIRLVCPPGECVVDPFAGSGTTLEAAYLEGMEAIGVEVTQDYLPLIKARLDRVESAA